MSKSKETSVTADVAVIIGRWQILQKGHSSLIRAALDAAPQVVVVIGSAFRARDPRNPFTWQERQQQFEAVLAPEERARVSFLPVRDYFDDDRWVEAVRAGVARVAGAVEAARVASVVGAIGEIGPAGAAGGLTEASEASATGVAAARAGVALIGFKKDHTSNYLDNFPGWPLFEVEPKYAISSTELRKIYFEVADHATALATIGNFVEPGVKAFLEAWLHLPAYRKVAAEHKAILAYKKKWGAPVALTADSVVTASGHVLLIRRGGEIGNGLWALPGGFLDANERFYAAAVRELAEETQFEAPPACMKSALHGEAVFDHPLRSARGRIVTMAYHFDFGDTPLPEVRGSDDAKEAHWIPIADLPAMEDQIFEDHAAILDRFLNLWPRSVK